MQRHSFSNTFESNRQNWGTTILLWLWPESILDWQASWSTVILENNTVLPNQSDLSRKPVSDTR